MTHPWSDWTHITKLDPDKSLHADESFEDVCKTGTDAIAIGGTTDMTETKMKRVVDACAAHNTPLYQEPSMPSVVIEHPALNGYFVPTVLNAQDPTWILGAHQEWLRLDTSIDFQHTHTEGYIVLNENASVATYTDANCDQSPESVAALATAGEQFFGQDIIYLEYSGTLGDPQTIQETQTTLDSATLFYGGGIHDYDSAVRMAEHADTIIVGDLVHDHGVEALTETVHAANDANQ